MIQKIDNGAYVELNNGWLVKVDYLDELLQNAVQCIKAKRGKFYPDKNFGSKIGEAVDISPMLALAYARQAVDSLDGVYIKSCDIADNGYHFSILVNDEERQVAIPYAEL